MLTLVLCKPYMQNPQKANNLLKSSPSLIPLQFHDLQLSLYLQPPPPPHFKEVCFTLLENHAPAKK